MSGAQFSLHPFQKGDANRRFFNGDQALSPEHSGRSQRDVMPLRFSHVHSGLVDVLVCQKIA